VDLIRNEEVEDGIYETEPAIPDKFSGLEVFCPDCLETFILDETEDDVICSWIVSLGGDCPSCGEFIELVEGMKADDVAGHQETGELDLLFDTDMICPECEHVFNVEKPDDFLPVL
jgi:hypothetical protein